ncbi:hypothetical protein MRX96_059494 [Rhipicephalus microplus]
MPCRPGDRGITPVPAECVRKCGSPQQDGAQIRTYFKEGASFQAAVATYPGDAGPEYVGTPGQTVPAGPSAERGRLPMATTTSIAGRTPREPYLTRPPTKTRIRKPWETSWRRVPCPGWRNSCTRRRIRVYAYVLGYRPMYSSWTDETEAVHFDDMELVFGVPLRPGSPSSQMDKQWSRTMIHVWSTFARTGKPPTVKTSKWPAYDSHRLTTMKLGPRGVTAQRDPKWQRCRALRDSGGAAVSTSPLRATQHGHYAPSRRP